MIREAISNPEHPYYPFIHRLVTDIGGQFMKTLVANFFINANLAGWKKQDECHRGDLAAMYRGQFFLILPAHVTFIAQDAGQQSMATS